ncbi:MAG: hypothetical protein EXS39_03705 [Opitutaceae bacterium]|nr:hypothetical protein [Opitutaceae bacterium]
MNLLRVGVVGFDITPRFHPRCGAYGSTYTMTEVDLPLLARCIALDQGGCRVLWFGSDSVGETIKGTDVYRDEIAGALGLQREQLIWSTSQTHSSGAVPGSLLTGSGICDLSNQDPEFMAAERKRFIASYIEAAREAIRRLQPAKVWAGRGYCDSVSYNRRFPMPTGGVKFSRHHAEGRQGGKFFDPTIDLLRFDDTQGRTLGAIFNFCCHPATMINDRMISPDWVGTARAHIEEAIGGAPAMYVQGFCGDVNCHHIFGTPELAKRTGARLGRAAVEALPNLIPVRGEPLLSAFKTIEVQCQPMFPRAEFERQLAVRQAFIDELPDDPAATWFDGINFPEQMSPTHRALGVQLQMEHMREGLRMLDAGEAPRSALPLTLGALRIGDVAAMISPGENFTQTGMDIRLRSPFTHTLVCGDTNGHFGYLGTDGEIDRGGYGPYGYWKMMMHDGFRLPPAKGTAGRIIQTGVELLQNLAKVRPGR